MLGLGPLGPPVPHSLVNVSTNSSLDYIFYLLYLLRYLILKAMNFSEEPQQSDIENFYVLWYKVAWY